MLLETLDLRTNDILIYSQNQFNFNENFRIIYKNERIKRPHRITYFDVCNYVKDPTPKNLIIYRLLTNVNNLDAYSTKYGYFIKINGKMELVYFDPIFAIKDLRHLRFDLDPERFRFKIQQAGLTSLTKKEVEPNFAEVYSFDLRAVEAQNQNDKIFADAIFAFDTNFIDEEIKLEMEDKLESKERTKRNIPFAEAVLKPFAKMENIAEDHTTGKVGFSTVSAPGHEKVNDLREEIIGLLKQALGIQESASVHKIKQEDSESDSLNIQKQLHDDAGKGYGVTLLDLFKSTNKSDDLSLREKKLVVLKFDG